MMQEGKSAGLTGSISGIADSYFGKNKGRTIEGALEKATTVLICLLPTSSTSLLAKSPHNEYKNDIGA